MMMQPLFRYSTVFAALLGLAGCAQTDGPVLGDWHGRQPTGAGIYSSYVDLVLHGAPGAVEGEYDFQANKLDPTLTNVGDRTLTWGGRWTLTRTAASGATQILELHDLPSSQVSRYALTPKSLLVPLTSAAQPDTSRYGLQYALSPVPRTSWRFGRL